MFVDKQALEWFVFHTINHLCSQFFVCSCYFFCCWSFFSDCHGALFFRSLLFHYLTHIYTWHFDLIFLSFFLSFLVLFLLFCYNLFKIYFILFFVLFNFCLFFFFSNRVNKMNWDSSMPTSELMNYLRSNEITSMQTYTYTVCTHIQCTKLSKKQIN